MKVYLSGPMTGVRDLNREAFRQAAEVLRMLGNDVVNPHELDGEFAEPGNPSHAWYMARDLDIILNGVIEAVVVLPGWKFSEGALAEVVCAQAIGLDVFSFDPLMEPVEKIVGYATSGLSTAARLEFWENGGGEVVCSRDECPIGKGCSTCEAQEPRAGSPRFYQLLEECASLHESKNKDYASAADPFQNFRGSERVGVPAWKGALIRLQDKVSRIEGFAERGELAVKDESVEDTLKDLAIYALICLVLREEERANGGS